MQTIPKWAVFTALGVIVLAGAFVAMAARKRYLNECKAAELLERGQLKLSDSDIQQIINGVKGAVK